MSVKKSFTRSCRAFRFRPLLVSAGLVLIALLAAGCTSPGSVTFSPLAPVVNPFSQVLIEIDHENRQIRATPDPVIIWFDSANPYSQILWTVRCVSVDRRNKDDVTCPRDTMVIIRPKKGCSTTLFGATASAPEGEIRIRAPFNAVASGEPNTEEARSLLSTDETSETACDGTPRAEAIPMELSQSAHDIKWVYEIEVRRPGQKPFILDPAAWIEKDG